jgi:hypothetical protein
MAQKYASFAAKDTREAGSLPSDFDATIVAAQFTKEAPDGYQADGNPIFANISYLRRDIEGTEQERTLVQSYNLGGKAGDEFTISDDGYGLIPTDDSVASIRKGSKFDLWKCSTENEGVPQTITEQGDLSKFIGLDGHWRRVEDAKLLGKAREFNNDQKKASKFPQQTLVLVKLISLPGEKAAPKAGSKTTAAAPAAAAAGEDLDSAVVGFLMDVLANAKDNKVQRSQLIALLSKAAIKAPNRQDIARRGSDEAFLMAQVEAGVITYDPAAKPQVVGLAA